MNTPNIRLRAQRRKVPMRTIASAYAAVTGREAVDTDHGYHWVDREAGVTIDQGGPYVSINGPIPEYQAVLVFMKAGVQGTYVDVEAANAASAARRLNDLVANDVDVEIAAVLAGDQYAEDYREYRTAGVIGDPEAQVLVGSHWLTCYSTKARHGKYSWWTSLADKDGEPYVKNLSDASFREMMALGRARYDSPGEGQPEEGSRKTPPMAHTAATMLALGVGLWFTVPPAVNGMEAAAGAMDVACIRTAR